MFAPLKHATFRTLWTGMGLSYAGDRLQELAQGWLVATLTGSALAVGSISALSSIKVLATSKVNGLSTIKSFFFCKD